MIRAAVRAWGAGDRADEIELVADELITNALMHTDGAAVVTLRALAGPRAGGCAWRSRTPPARCRAAARRASSGVSGRGLLLVDRWRTSGVWRRGAAASACGASSSCRSTGALEHGRSCPRRSAGPRGTLERHAGTARGRSAQGLPGRASRRPRGRPCAARRRSAC